MNNYNTGKKPLIIREYGRNVQKLVEHAKTIENKEMRQAYIEKVVEMITHMDNNVRNQEDYTLKVWSHILKIGKYELDVTPPDDVPAYPEMRKAQRVPYPSRLHRYRHYGKNVHNLVEKAIAMEDEDKQRDFAEIIGAYMKMAYKNWNRENVSDEIIIEDLKTLSNNQLNLEEKAELDALLPKRKATAETHTRHNNHNNRSKHKRNHDRNRKRRHNKRK